MFTNEGTSFLWDRWMTVLFTEHPGDALMTLVSMGVADPEVTALSGVPQPAKWHPEGDVLIHTAMALDEARSMCNGDVKHDLALMLGTLCHDFGKATTTAIEPDGKVTAKNHDVAGEAPTRSFLGRLEAHEDVIERVVCLVREHLVPPVWGRTENITTKAYNRLMRRLIAADVDVQLLYEVSRADVLGRDVEHAEREFKIDNFLKQMDDAKKAVEEETTKAKEKSTDVVDGSHLIARKLKPGPEFRDILAQCREVQDSKGLTDPDSILNIVLEGRKV